MKFSYIDLINIFNEWSLDYGVSANIQIVFFKILYFIDKYRWQEWTKISNARLAMSCGIHEHTLIRLRNKLIKFGIFSYKGGKKGEPGSYKINEKFFDNSG